MAWILGYWSQYSLNTTMILYIQLTSALAVAVGRRLNIIEQAFSEETSHITVDRWVAAKRGFH